jgi:catechol 2,3-dioxygenase
MLPGQTASAPGFGIAPGGNRLPTATRLGRVRLQIADLDRSVAWYRRVMGLELRDARGNRAVLGAGALPEPLIELRELPGAAPVPERGRLGLYHAALRLPDRRSLANFVQHALAAGVELGASDHLVSEAIYLRDPDGHGLEVYVDRPQEGWKGRDTPQGRELVMVTEPLDMDGLVAIAAEVPWSGIAGDTVVGHVHLHVGNLEQARDFYHRGLGMDLVVWSYPGALFFSAGGYHHHVGLNVWSGPEAVPAPADEARLVSWTLIVPAESDLEALADRLEAAGYPVTRAEPGYYRAADPWGTQVVMRTPPR